MSKKVPNPGDLIQIALPSGRLAYGRVLRDACVSFYFEKSGEPGRNVNVVFTVGVYADALTSRAVKVVGSFEPESGEDLWPPPMSVRDPISGSLSVYHKGEIRAASPREADELEPAAVWSLDQIVDRLETLPISED